VGKVRKAKLSAALSAVFPRLPSTSSISPFNDFPEDVWSKIIDMDNVDMGVLLKRKTKSSVKMKTETKSSKKIVDMGLVVAKEKKKTKSSLKKMKTETKSSKKRKADTKSETEESEQPTKKRRSSRRRSS